MPLCYILGTLVGVFPPLARRYYSISNALDCQVEKAPHSNDTVITLAVSIAQWKAGSVQRRGLFTNAFEGLLSPFLADVPPKTPTSLPLMNVLLKSGNDFGLPEDNTKPIIMVGPGTGVSPFMGFLQERERRMKEARKSPRGE